MKNLESLEGQHFGRLTAIKYVGIVNHRRTWLCRCDCGKEKIVSATHLTTLHTQSCGCLAKENSLRIGRSIKHGLTFENGKVTRLYRIWTCMKNRCFNPNTEQYVYYGSRGIKVCKEWLDYKVFHDWALSHGYQDNLTIDRIDNDKDYEPDNCRWVTNIEQARNKRNSIFVDYNGQHIGLKRLSEITGVSYQTLYWRYKYQKTL